MRHVYAAHKFAHFSMMHLQYNLLSFLKDVPGFIRDIGSHRDKRVEPEFSEFGRAFYRTKDAGEQSYQAVTNDIDYFSLEFPI
jgi:hypothetical protein